MTTHATPTANEATPGFLAILLDLYLAPWEAFAAILKRPSFWPPLLLAMALNASFTAVWLHKVDAKEFMRARVEESGRMEKIPVDQRDEMLENQAKVVPVMAGLGPVFVVIIAALVAGVLTFVFRFFYAGEVTFRLGFTLTAWVFAAVGLVTTPLLLLTLFLKDDWTLDPQQVLQANPSLFFERGEIAAPLFSLLSSLDLFSFWGIFLLALGLGLAARVRFSSAVWGVLVPWALYVLAKVAGAALFG
jgi:hypothetical protein